MSMNLENRTKEFDVSLIQKVYGNMTGPLNIMWDITNGCNLNCKHCYNRSGKGRKYEDLSDEDMLKQVDFIIELLPRVVCFCGGEPLLRYNLLPKIANRLSRAGITVNMVTNGLLLDDEKIDNLISNGLSSFQISLDSHKKETHDYFRGKIGAYDGALKAIELLISKDIIPEITFIPTKVNYRDLEGLVEMLYLKGIRKIGSMPFIPIGRGCENKEELLMSDDNLLDFYQILNKLRAKVPDFKIEYDDPLEHITLFINNKVAKTAVFEIRSNGDIVVSSYLPIIYGNVLKSDMVSLWRSGLKDVWRDSRVVEVANKIKTLDDFLGLVPKPWNNEDIDVSSSYI